MLGDGFLDGSNVALLAGAATVARDSLTTPLLRLGLSIAALSVFFVGGAVVDFADAVAGVVAAVADEESEHEVDDEYEEEAAEDEEEEEDEEDDADAADGNEDERPPQLGVAAVAAFSSLLLRRRTCFLKASQRRVNRVTCCCRAAFSISAAICAFRIFSHRCFRWSFSAVSFAVMLAQKMCRMSPFRAASEH